MDNQINEAHRCCHGGQQQQQSHPNVVNVAEKCDPFAATAVVETADTFELGGGGLVGKRPLVFDKVLPMFVQSFNRILTATTKTNVVR